MSSAIRKLFRISMKLTVIANTTILLYTPLAQAQKTDPKAKVAPAQETTPSSRPSPEDGCKKLFQKYVLPLQDLWRKRGPDLRPENTDGYALIEDITVDHCDETETRNELISLLARILNSHSGKVGVVLSIAKNPETRHMINAFEAHASSLGLDPKKTFIIIDSQDKEDKTKQALASLVFEHKVTALIGGLEPREAEILRSLGASLMLPTFIMSEPPNSPASPSVYYVHPSQKTLAKAAVDANVRFGHKRVAILSPSDQHSDRFVKAYSDIAKSAGITVTHQVSYDPKRFDLMEAAAKKIFRLDGSDRQDELKKLYETAKQHAKETGTKFNPKMIALQPDIQQDAILIPDNFRIVRHFAKILVFLGVRKLPLFGHYEWRSVGLISPWDSFLAESYFVDFQGSYANMPAPIKIPTTESPFFIHPDKIEQADYSILAWRAIATPLLLSQKRSEARRKLDKQIPRKFGGENEPNFDQENNLVWPAYLFKVNGTNKSGHLSLISP